MRKVKISHKQPRLFWYLKKGTELDLDKPEELDLYVQEILTHGKAEDVKELLQILPFPSLKSSFQRIKNFLPREVKSFWEKNLGDT
ncbi:hypothetical protein J7K56_00740 [Candidatus Calescamantes bacterium]|nr:hypothetical protein [Candidatus Calescamantes bacterium]